MTIAIYQEHRDCFVVEATDRSNETEERFGIAVLHVIQNDPHHGIQYVAGDEFTVSFRKGEDSHWKEWELTPLTNQPTDARAALDYASGNREQREMRADAENRRERAEADLATALKTIADLRGLIAAPRTPIQPVTLGRQIATMDEHSGLTAVAFNKLAHMFPGNHAGAIADAIASAIQHSHGRAS